MGIEQASSEEFFLLRECFAKKFVIRASKSFQLQDHVISRRIRSIRPLVDRFFFHVQLLGKLLLRNVQTGHKFLDSESYFIHASQYNKKFDKKYNFFKKFI